MNSLAFLPVIPAPSPGARASRPQSRAGRHFPQLRHSRFLTPPFPRKRESRGAQPSPLPEIKRGCAGGTPALPGAASRQNQDLRDYRIFRIRQARVFDRQALIRNRMGGICGYGEKRNSGEAKS